MLRFPLLQLPVNVLGDVVISVDTAARQAAERRYGLRDEARVLLVHGVLHLLGFDHEDGGWVWEGVEGDGSLPAAVLLPGLPALGVDG